MKTVFVVLHYCQVEVTKDCVESLLKLDGERDVVIVDNASPDGSGYILNQFYSDNDNVKVLLNKDNLGFAGGNNVGYVYAKGLNPDFIIILNNDTLINDKDFLNKLGKDNLLQYHIIAPDIITYKGKHQNPFKRAGITKKEVLRLLRRKRLSLLFYSLPLLYKLKTFDEPKEIGRIQKDRMYDIVPHGAAIIFTRQWIENEDLCFRPGTFMYFEEDLLYLYIKKHNYRTIYEPSLQITHLEDMSTNVAHKNIRKRMIFQNKQKIKSLKAILNFMKD